MYFFLMYSGTCFQIQKYLRDFTIWKMSCRGNFYDFIISLMRDNLGFMDLMGVQEETVY